MKKTNAFIEHLIELLQGVGEVKARAMFGGYGLYLTNVMDQENTMFALVTNDALYFKTDNGNIGDFEARKLEAFSYLRNGNRYSMSYYEAPSEALDDADKMTSWAIRAIDAARRCKDARHKKTKH